MKLKYLITVAACFGMLLFSCGGDKGNKKFNPEDRTTSKMSDDERMAAIAQKKAELTIDPYVMMTSNDVKLSVMPPTPQGDLNEGLSEKIAVKMLQIIAQNGIGGLNTVPGFALTATLTEGEKKTTGTAPQKMVAQYTINYSVINTVTGDVYATASQDITGVGNSFPQATRNAINEIKNSPAIQQMLSTGSEKIISWFNDNVETFKGQVEAAYEKGDYALAISLIESVPQKSTAAFEYAQGRRKDINEKFLNSIASQELVALKQAIQESGNNPSAEVYAHLKLLPQGSPQFEEASKLIEKYENDVQIKTAQDNADAKVKAELDAQRAQEVELANIEAERLKAKYQAKATEQALRQRMREKDDKDRGFWGNLGARIIGAIDGVTDGDGYDDDK
ncbi:MAG: hypothetical protein J1F16_08060 [Muribaculaceae bacterium]|nr:hypothetical protein [Muribaculaceae bacterium]